MGLLRTTDEWWCLMVYGDAIMAKTSVAAGVIRRLYLYMLDVWSVVFIRLHFTDNGMTFSYVV